MPNRLKRKSKSKRKSKHRCIWYRTDHEYRAAYRCKICKREKTRLSCGKFKYIT